MQTIAPTALLFVPLALAACGSSDHQPASNAEAGTEAPGAPEAVATPGTPAPEGATAPPIALPPAPQLDPTTVVVTVNDVDLTEGEVNDESLRQISMQTQGAQIPPEQLAMFTASMRPQVLEGMIDGLILDSAVAEADVEVDEAYVRAEFDRNFEAYLLQANLTREEVGERVQAMQGITLEEMLDEQAADPEAKRMLQHAELIRSRYPEETQVLEEDVAAAYERDRVTAFTRPEQVRASHILVPDRAQAEELVVLARTADVAFADLAREHSTGPSAPDGGDLGFFPREGAMIEPFAAAAFAMQPGEISEVVETQYGFHVIQVTDRTPATELSYEDVAPMIRSTLEMQKINELRTTLIASLRESAVIVYPEGSAPPAAGGAEDHSGHNHAPGEGHGG